MFAMKIAVFTLFAVTSAFSPEHTHTHTDDCNSDTDDASLLQTTASAVDELHVKSNKEDQMSTKSQEPRKIPTLAITFPRQLSALLEGGELRNMLGSQGETSFAFQVVHAAGPETTDANGQEEIMYPTNASVVGSDGLLAVVSEQGIPAGSFVCAGHAPGVQEFFRSSCSHVESTLAEFHDSISKANMIIHASISETIGEKDFKAAASQISHLARESPENAVVLMDAHVHGAVLAELGEHSAKTKTFRVNGVLAAAGWFTMYRQYGVYGHYSSGYR